MTLLEVGKVTSNQVIKRSQLELPGRFFVVRKSRRGDLPDVSSEKKLQRKKVGIGRFGGRGHVTHAFFLMKGMPPPKKKDKHLYQVIQPP